MKKIKVILKQNQEEYPGLTKRSIKLQKKIQKKHCKEILKFLKKNYSMYQSDWMLEVNKMFCEHFYQYFRDGLNVWSADTDKQFKSLYTIMSVIEDIQNLDKRIDEDDEKDIKYSQSLYEQRLERISKFFTYIGEHIDEWWD